MLARLRDRFVAGDRNASHVVTKVADDRLDIHRDDRLILDDQHVGERLTLDFLERLGDQAVDVLRAGANQIGRVLRGKPSSDVSSSAWREAA